MEALLLITGISLYIISIVVSLIMAVAANKFSVLSIQRIVVFHFVLLAIVVVLIILSKTNNGFAGIASYSSIIVFCTGMALAGLVLGSQSKLILKIYFGMYLCTIIIFIVSPSKLISFIATGTAYSNTENRFPLGSNYFLESQQSMINKKDQTLKYKIYRKLGMFNQTIVRDVDFGNKIDSVHVLIFEANKNALLRSYFSKENKTDSNDIRIDLTKSLDENTLTKGK